MYDYNDVEFAMVSVRVLGLILVIAVVAFAAKSRAMFVAGTLGVLLGGAVPPPECHVEGTVAACFMGGLERSASHVLRFGAVGAVVACVAVGAVQHSRLSKQFSLRTILLAFTALAIVAAMARYFAL